MCYPNGGSEPTITDANLVLGRIPPALIGGGIALDVERARDGIAALAARLPGNHERRAARRGHHRDRQLGPGQRHPADDHPARHRSRARFALLSFGGSGPAQSPAVMELMGMKACIVPPNPGNLSAFGLLAVDWRTDHIVTKVMHEDAVDLAAIAGHLSRRWKRTRTRRWRRTASRRRSIALAARSRRALCRPVDGSARAGACGQDRRAFVTGLIDAFHAAHRKTFGYNYAGQQKVELVNFCVSGFRHDRSAEHSRSWTSPAAPPEPSAAARFISTASSATRRSSSAPRCRPASRSTGRRSSRNSARPQWCFPASN